MSLFTQADHDLNRRFGEQCAEVGEDYEFEITIQPQKLHEYRIIDGGDMGVLSTTYVSLLRELEDLSKADTPPSQADIEDLKMITQRIGTVLRSVDWADKFVVVHADDIVCHTADPDEEKRFTAMQNRLLPEVAHRSLLAVF